jgi:hypothetical protein
VFLHELGVHDDHPPEDFRPPFRIDKLFSIQMDPAAKCSHIDASAACISNAHSILDILLKMSIGELRSIPIFNFVRMAYSSILLVKLLISSKSPQSKIGAVIDPQSLKLGFYLEELIKKLNEAVGPMECRAPYTFLGLLMRLHKWYKSQEDDQYFVAPTSLQYDPDECWLPPVPAHTRSDILNGLTNEYQFLETKDFNHMPGLDMDNAIQDEDFQYDMENDLLADQFLSYDVMAPIDSNFDAWIPDLNMSDMLDNSQAPQAYDWGFPTTDNPL